jgi:hypothetical protein
LAAQSCTFCFGRGLRSGRRGQNSPCACVLRHIFRVCHARFCLCLDKEKHLSQVSLTRIPGSKRGLSFGRKDEEYIADFLLLSRRNLDAEEMPVFKAHMLMGADWKLCCRQLNLDRGSFFHIVYRIMHKLGRLFFETRPYALFPIDSYYECQTGIELPSLAAQAREQRKRKLRERHSPRPVVPPLRTAA